jgi:hypothetical protein
MACSPVRAVKVCTVSQSVSQSINESVNHSVNQSISTQKLSSVQDSHRGMEVWKGLGKVHFNGWVWKSLGHFQYCLVDGHKTSIKMQAKTNKQKDTHKNKQTLDARAHTQELTCSWSLSLPWWQH